MQSVDQVFRNAAGTEAAAHQGHAFLDYALQRGRRVGVDLRTRVHIYPALSLHRPCSSPLFIASAANTHHVAAKRHDVPPAENVSAETRPPTSAEIIT